MNPLMKAIVFTRHGPPDVLQLKEVDRPSVKNKHILVKVHAASVNALDSHMTRGMLKIQTWLEKVLKPKACVRGADFSGVVDMIGEGVTKFKIGDEVYGAAEGSFAEYVLVHEDKTAIKPGSVTFHEAAAVPVAALTALQGLRDYGKIKQGQQVLINGAGGGVGTFAVQIAKAFGAEVTATCSESNMQRIRSIGADHVVDYRKESIITGNRQFDLIFAVNGYYSIIDYKRILKASGVFVMAGASKSQMFTALFQAMLLGPVLSLFSNKKFKFFVAHINPDDLEQMNEFLISGKVKASIDREYSLEEVPQAIAYLEQWHSQGKIIIRVV